MPTACQKQPAMSRFAKRRVLPGLRDHVASLIAALAAMLSIGGAQATPINLGDIYYSSRGSGIPDQFYIQDRTGPLQAMNGDPNFVVATPVHFGNLNFVVNFSDGSSQTYGPSSNYFTLNTYDGLSFSGAPIDISGANPRPVSAVLTGNFRVTNVTLVDGTSVSLDSAAFSATVLSSFGGQLRTDDFDFITATYGAVPVPTPVPEPDSLILCLGAAALTGFVLRRRWRAASR